MASVASTRTKSDSAKIKSYLFTILENSTAIPFKKCRNKYMCCYCDYTSHLPSKLKDHKLTEHKNIDFDNRWKFLTEFSSQSNIMLDIQNLNCRLCHTNIPDMNNLKIHFSEIHKEILPKNIQNNVFYFKLFDDIITCYICKQNFEDFDHLFDHVKSHQRLTCPSCEETFSSNQDLNKHDKTYCKPCNLCDLRFSSLEYRDIHLKQAHCKSYRCDFCSKNFTLKGTLSRHIRNIHFKEKNVTCDICGKTFFDNHYLNLHRVTHRNSKPFQCNLCQTKFARVGALKLHTRIHTNDRRYVCQICDKSFVQWSALNMHKTVHTEERNFKCPACDRAFKDKKTMDKHCKNVHHKEDIKKL